MIRKRSHRKISSDWNNFDQKFSDLLQQDSSKIPKIGEISDISRLSQEIDDEDSNHVGNVSCHDSADLFSSPVSEIKSNRGTLKTKCRLSTPLNSGLLFSSPIGNATPKRNPVLFSSSVVKCCTPKRNFSSLLSDECPSLNPHKSTPSGSPILENSFRHADKVNRRSLLPLSPITPGADWSHFASVFSVHGNDTSIPYQSHEQTTLAVPLDVTDEEIDDFTQEKNVAENKPENDEELEISDRDFSQNVDLKPKNLLDTTGSKWIKNVQEKIEEDWKKKAAKLSENLSFYDDISLYDSGKKLKIMKGGLAEKLSIVIKKEQAQKSVFSQKLKTKKLAKEDNLHLKILSDVKQGLLRIIECRNNEEKAKCEKSLSYTLILPEEFVETLDLSLGLDIRVYPPFQKLNTPNSNTTVLLSAYNIITENNDSTKTVDHSGGCNSSQSTQNFENLLECLEAQMNCDERINIVATIQRVFCQFKSVEKWSILCSDAYGTVFLIDSQKFSSNSSLIKLLTSGEGQRVVFKNLFVKSRMTKSQSPSLFSVVDSIWDPRGEGFLHSGSSQSQLSADANSVPLLPPSYCYLLCSDETSWVVFPTKETDFECLTSDCNKTLCLTVSDLNRPSIKVSVTHNDILYCASKIAKFAEIFENNFDKTLRFSVVCKFLEFKANSCDSQDLYCSQHNDNDVTMLVKPDNPEVLDSKSYEVIVRSSCLLPHNMSNESILVMKDVCIVSSTIEADGFSRVKLLDCSCEVRSFLKLESV